jgi:hypothetical protein
MSGLGYQLGKLLGTAVVTLSRLNKGVYIAIALLSLLLILFLYGAIRTNKLRSSSSSHYLQVGKSARVTNSAQQVNMRRSSGYQNKPRSDVITTVPAGEMVEIVGGPEHSDDLIWWLVRWDAYQGWIAEHTVSQRVLLEPI